jgi:ankyrin repeat protein
MTDKPQNIPAPIRMAQEALKILEAEDSAPEGLNKSLAGFAMQLARAGEEVTVELLLSRARSGDMGVEKAGQKTKTYDEIVAKLNKSTEFKQEENKPVTDIQIIFDAIKAGDLEQVKNLVRPVENGLYARGMMLLNVAIKAGHLDIIKFLIEEKEIPKSGALVEAVKAGHMDVVKYFVEEQKENIQGPVSCAVEWAAISKQLPIMKYLVENGADAHIRGEMPLGEATRNGDLEMVKYLVEEQGADIHAQKGWVFTVAARSGHVEVMKYLMEERGGDFVPVMDHALEEAAEHGRLDAVKYLLEEPVAYVPARNSLAMALAATYGYLEVVKYIAEKKTPHMQPARALEEAARSDDLAIVKYLVEEAGVEVNACEGAALRVATTYRHLKIMQYLVEERHADTSNLAPEYKPYLEKALVSLTEWQKVAHIDTPRGLEGENPYYYKPKVYEAVQVMLHKESLFGSEYIAFVAGGLFGTVDRVLKYLENWGQEGRYPLRDLFQKGIDLPPERLLDADLALWGDAVIKCGPSMAKLFKYAHKMPVPEKSSDGKTWSMVNTRDKIAQFAFERGSENLMLAKLCVEHGVDEKRFNDALDVASNPPSAKNIPEIVIDGEKFYMEGAKFYRLPVNDVRGLFLGEMTDCCQSIGAVGDLCARHGFSSENDGFYVVENAKGKVIGETWAWRGTEGELVFDSLETLGGQVSSLQWEKLVEAFASALNESSDVTALHIGTSGFAGTPKELLQVFAKAAKPAIPVDHENYQDSEAQIAVWRKPRKLG